MKTYFLCNFTIKYVHTHEQCNPKEMSPAVIQKTLCCTTPPQKKLSTLLHRRFNRCCMSPLCLHNVYRNYLDFQNERTEETQRRQNNASWNRCEDTKHSHNVRKCHYHTKFWIPFCALDLLQISWKIMATKLARWGTDVSCRACNTLRIMYILTHLTILLF